MPTLDWIGREAVINHHNDVPYRLLRCDSEISYGDPDSGNLLIEGDNLEALKALLPYYGGQVKCIYIDPPYNTGEGDWAYNDAVDSPQIRAWLGRVVGRDDLSRHDKWLCMMYPRVQLLHELLSQDGVIIVAIDDNELPHLHLLMHQIFGEKNLIATLIWEKTRKNDAKLFSVGHDYMLVYGRNKEHLRLTGTIWREPKPGAREILEEYDRLRSVRGHDNEAIERDLGAWFASLPKDHPSKRLSRYRHVDDWCVWRDRDISWPGGGGPRYDVVHPVTGLPCKVPQAGWRFATPEEMQRQIALGLVVFRDDHTEPPIRKAYLRPRPLPEETDELAEVESEEEDSDDQVGLQVMPSVIYKHNQPSVRLLRRIMGRKAFNNPKDHEVLARLLEYMTRPGDIILDSFCGSASTGQAVLLLNARSRVKRRFILVELEPQIARDVAAERLRRVIAGYTWQDDKQRVHHEAGIDGGFRYCALGATLFDADQAINPEVTFAELAAHIFFTETHQPLPEAASLDSPRIGVYRGTSFYLFFNGVRGGSRLDASTLALIDPCDGPAIAYADTCALSPRLLTERGVTFKQIPYEVTSR